MRVEVHHDLALFVLLCTKLSGSLPSEVSTSAAPTTLEEPELCWSEKGEVLLMGVGINSYSNSNSNNNSNSSSNSISSSSSSTLRYLLTLSENCVFFHQTHLCGGSLMV